ncbi:thiolase family protein [Primorskyibacter aestuariivivens]|uniref:thiolase family protein n=1 Tax=Primorskyibacter aestuariivivens TaxID=1888912 RepID=UPI00230194A8|nr:thiolase family protein [Primorskyibacter aestuariivivens]MDA7430099.1 thiolase family protein [Primorskyibacter aestuariivivens]
MAEVVICSAKRTPMGGFQGEFGGIGATDLGAIAIRAAIADAGIAGDDVDETIMGIVLSAGVGQAPARQACLGAGLPLSTPATAISKVCGSGMQAVIQGCNQISSGFSRFVVAGGMESMSNAPYLSPNTRSGARLGHVRMLDHMFFDGLEDAYEGGLMGSFAENCARKYEFSREAQDAYAIASLNRALAATDDGVFTAEIAPVTIKTRSGEQTIRTDEQPRNARPDKIPQLKPAFAKDGTVTAANASSISDGAAALFLASRDAAAAKALPVRARIVGFSGHAQEPGWFTTAPVAATRKLLDRIGWTIADVDLWEVNEAFAVVAMAFMQDLDIDHETLNVNGGACALGHPIGASGARILVTLLHALEQRDLKRGVAAICIGGGEALAVAIERE